MRRRTILGIFAHPDDESMGPGGTLAKCAAGGHRVVVLTATEGGAGRLYRDRPGSAVAREELKRVRREETLRATRVLGIEHLGFLGWEDGGIRKRDALEVEEMFAAWIRREKPDVVLTFHGSGISRHPDHRIITMAVDAAFHGAARGSWYQNQEVESLEPHRAARLYHYTVTESLARLKWPRPVYVSPEDEITTRIDTTDFADLKWEAIQAHASQQYGPPFRTLYEEGVFRSEAFVRRYPGAVPGAETETDLLGDSV